MEHNRKLLILGTSLFAPEVLDTVRDIGGYQVTAFVENHDRDKVGTTISGVPVIWIGDAADLREDHYCLCSLGTTHRRIYIEQAEELGLKFTTLIHPTARVSRTSRVGAGSFLGVGSIVASNTQIGAHVIVNRGCLIGHDTSIGDYVTISPGANVAGAVRIDSAAYIGMGAIVLDRIEIGRQALVGAGSVVTKNVPECTQVQGIPARIVKTGISGR